MIALHDFKPDTGSFAHDVLSGLRQPQKRIPSKYFYDETGSRLFEQICLLPEYYPTRTEQALLERIAPDVARLAGPGCQLIELGSGASRKVRTLLDALERPHGYVPVDIAREALVEAAEAIAADYPALAVTAICADYTRPFDLPPNGQGRRIAFFPGSTIGNLTPAQAIRFLRGCVGLVGRGGAMLVGVDRKKDPAVLHAAYNDAAGVTAAFNLNLLDRINRELGGSFERRRFAHRAFYDPREGRIEMHLVALAAHSVQVAGERFSFADGETIHTEDSYKYAPEEFAGLAREAGFVPRAAWSDADALFSLHYLSVG